MRMRMKATRAAGVRERKKLRTQSVRFMAAATATVTSIWMETMTYTLRMKAQRSSGLSIMYPSGG